VGKEKAFFATRFTKSGSPGTIFSTKKSFFATKKSFFSAKKIRKGVPTI
jgi:hypothetical protein